MQNNRTSERSRAGVIFYLGEYGSVQRRSRRLFGRRLRPWELAGLAGAPDDALVEVGMLRRALYLEWYERSSLAYHAVQLVQQAGALGIERIELVAGRGPGENGYYSWPRYGFAGPLAPEVQRRLPPGLEQARNVLDLMDSAAARAWWKAHGTTIGVAFDVREGSRSWRVFQGYLRERSQRGPADNRCRPAAT